MTRREIEASCEAAITEAQLAIVDGEYVEATKHLLKAWGEAMRLAYPPKPDRAVARLLAGEGD